jgi:hypothetical protein
MKSDKAITKALNRQEKPALPPGFESRMMAQIYRAEAKRKQQAFLFSIGLLSITSLGLIGMAVYLLRNYLSTATFRIPSLHLSTEALSQYGFGFYIASLILVLIVTDHCIRHFIQKKRAKQ